MTASLIAVLIVFQLGGFYMIALLYIRISKFDKTEKKQQQLMNEMEDSLALYITEVKEENDRLIDQLTKISEQPSTREKEQPMKQTQEKSTDSKVTAPKEFFQPKPPTSQVLNSYKAYEQASTPKEQEIPIKQKEESEFEKVYRLASEGYTPNEIASCLGKGKTEVELILKFKQ